MRKIKILIADDHEVIHSGIGSLLRYEESYLIVGNAYNGLEAIQLTKETKPDIIFMDISMPIKNGIEATREISDQFPEIKIIALTQHNENEYVMQIMKAGGKGYLLKNSKKEQFINAINTTIANNIYISDELSSNLLTQVFDKQKTNKAQDIVHLTSREIQIIQKIAEDKNNNEIADEFNISLRTVETHRRNIMQKLNAKSVVSVLKYAIAHNLVNL